MGNFGVGKITNCELFAKILLTNYFNYFFLENTKLLKYDMLIFKMLHTVEQTLNTGLFHSFTTSLAFHDALRY